MYIPISDRGTVTELLVDAGEVEARLELRTVFSFSSITVTLLRPSNMGESMEAAGKVWPIFSFTFRKLSFLRPSNIGELTGVVCTVWLDFSFPSTELLFVGSSSIGEPADVVGTITSRSGMAVVCLGVSGDDGRILFSLSTAKNPVIEILFFEDAGPGRWRSLYS